jgi:hypothetical protein
MDIYNLISERETTIVQIFSNFNLKDNKMFVSGDLCLPYPRLIYNIYCSGNKQNVDELIKFFKPTKIIISKDFISFKFGALTINVFMNELNRLKYELFEMSYDGKFAYTDGFKESLDDGVIKVKFPQKSDFILQLAKLINFKVEDKLGYTSNLPKYEPVTDWSYYNQQQLISGKYYMMVGIVDNFDSVKFEPFIDTEYHANENFLQNVNKMAILTHADKMAIGMAYLELVFNNAAFGEIYTKIVKSALDRYPTIINKFQY